MGVWAFLMLCIGKTHAQVPPRVEMPWTMVRGDSAGTGATKAELLPPWREFARLASPFRVTPVVAANEVVYFGASDHNVYAYRLPQPMLQSVVAAGTVTAQDVLTAMQSFGKLWQFPTGADIEAAPALAGGLLFVASTDHHLYALDAANGKLRWRARFEGDGRAAPVVDNGVIYVGADDRVFRALDAATGSTLWLTELPGEIRAPAAVGEEAVYVACADHFVYALNRRTGQEIWNADVGDDVTSPMTLADGKVFGVNLLGKLFALEQNNGKRAWSHPYPIMAETAPAFAEGRIFLTRDDGNVVALDVSSGEKLWTTAKKGGAPVTNLFGPNGTPSVNAPTLPRVRSAGSPVVGGRYVYVNAGAPQAVFILEARTGNVVETIKVDSPFGPRAVGTPSIGLQEDTSPPLYARARRIGQVHLALYGEFILVALLNSISVLGPYPIEVSSPDAPPPLKVTSRLPPHISAVLDVYEGPVQPVGARRLFAPNRTLRSADHVPITLDGRRSQDLLGHRLVKWQWVEDLGNAPAIQRFFGIGQHQIFLTVTDEEGEESEPASHVFNVGSLGLPGVGIQLPPSSGR
jgi:outer membrane protein assembly factor BamB